MSGIPISPERLTSVIGNLGIDTPITMLNLIRFYDKPQYPPNIDPEIDTSDNISGREAYMSRYIPAYSTIMERYGNFEVKFLSTNTMGIVRSTEDEPWDAVALIQYRKFKDFEDLTIDGEYAQKALPHRLATIKEWRLVACA